MAQATEDLRRHLHGLWSAVAPAWGEHAAYADARGAGVAERMLDLAGVGPGDRVLELACGPGGLGLAAAARGADVVLSDVVPEMVAIAQARAGGLATVTARVLDVEDIEQPDEAYDVVVCREGLMFSTEPERAAAEILRVLRPGGRAVTAVWGPRERNPWLGLVFDAVSAQLGRPVPPPGVPGPFSLAHGLDEVLESAGFADVAVDAVDVPLRAGSFDEWWTRTSALAGPLSAILASLPEPAAAALRARLREAIRPYESPEGIELPGVSLIASARRPLSAPGPSAS
jgi:SAM-dependent methyltransferase